MADGAPTFDFDEFEMKEFWQGELDMSKQARELYEEFVRLYLRGASLAPARSMAPPLVPRAAARRLLLLVLAAAASPVCHADQCRTSPPACARASRMTCSNNTNRSPAPRLHGGRSGPRRGGRRQARRGYRRGGTPPRRPRSLPLAVAARCCRRRPHRSPRDSYD
jgi:hypothetical protein